MESKWPLMAKRGPVVTEEDVIAFERTLGRRLPGDYRRFLLEVNGGRPAKENASFEFGVINMMYSLHDSNEVNDLLAHMTRERVLLLRPSKDLMSIGYDEGGAHILIALDSEHYGEIWFENDPDMRPEGANPRVHWFDRRDMEKLADNFEQFIGTLKPV